MNKVKPHRNTAAELSQEIIKLRLSLAKHLKPSKYISSTLREIRDPMIKKLTKTNFLAPNREKSLNRQKKFFEAKVSETRNFDQRKNNLQFGKSSNPRSQTSSYG